MGFGLKTIGNAVLSAIPFVGESFAAQQAQDFSAKQATDQMSFQGASSAQQMAFQEKMANTAHQREMADLKAAGLNPILAANNGAATPAGSSQSGAAGSGVAGSGAGSSAKLASSILMAEREKILAGIDKDKADTAVAKKQQEVLQHSAVEAEANAQIRKMQKTTAEKDQEFETKWGTQKRQADAVMNFIQKGASSAKDVFQMFRPKTGFDIQPLQAPKTKTHQNWLKPN